MSVFYFIVGCLATYRLTVLIARDAGPFQVFKRLRSLDKGTKMLRCPFCVSIWVGSFVALGFYLFGNVHETRAGWFFISTAFSAVAICLDRVFTADYTN